MFQCIDQYVRTCALTVPKICLRFNFMNNYQNPKLAGFGRRKFDIKTYR